MWKRAVATVSSGSTAYRRGASFFLVSLPVDFPVVAVVELDDLSHNQPDRQRVDTVKDAALKVAGHPIIRFKRYPMPCAEEIRFLIAGEKLEVVKA
jgi:Protein of unknown function (DUF2726)